MKIVIGVDDSAQSDATIDYVLEAAWPKTSKFVVVSAVAPVFMGTDEAVAADAITTLMQRQEKYHKEIADRAAARLRGSGLTAEARAVVGDPRAVLTDAAQSERADLIIVGSHGRTGFKRLLLGSVASHVVTHAACSVLVVRGDGAKRS